nr:hypothetical protein [uncultured Draconibacterium sp.]
MIKLNGTEAIQRVLTGLEQPLKTKILKKALALMAKPIIESAKSKV